MYNLPWQISALAERATACEEKKLAQAEDKIDTTIYLQCQKEKKVKIKPNKWKQNAVILKGKEALPGHV